MFFNYCLDFIYYEFCFEFFKIEDLSSIIILHTLQIVLLQFETPGVVFSPNVEERRLFLKLFLAFNSIRCV